jgi:hypothetical protein
MGVDVISVCSVKMVDGGLSRRVVWHAMSDDGLYDGDCSSHRPVKPVTTADRISRAQPIRRHRDEDTSPYPRQSLGR